jgi:hypothetical protein
VESILISDKIVKILKGKLLLFFLICFSINTISATEFSNNSFLIAEVNNLNIQGNAFWNNLSSINFSGIELTLDTAYNSNSVLLSGSNEEFSGILLKIENLIIHDSSKIIPVFINYNGNIELLDSIINKSSLSSYIFYLPQGEAWPSLEYLIQANRRVIFFVSGKYRNTSHVMHDINNYALQISASEISSKNEEINQ